MGGGRTLVAETQKVCIFINYRGWFLLGHDATEDAFGVGHWLRATAPFTLSGHGRLPHSLGHRNQIPKLHPQVATGND